MSPQSRRHWQRMGAIGLAIAILAVFNLVMSQTEIDLSPLQGKLPSRPAPNSKTEKTGPEIADLSLEQSLARPLFSPTRRDYVAEETPIEPVAEAVEEASKQPVTSPLQLSLRGTRTFNGVRSALVALPDQQGDWVSVGDEIDGWTIVEVGTDRLVVGRAGEKVSVALYPAAEASN
ncbi:hypothetical protein GCM10010924_61900 [Rhizobium wenxiniae]|uniref:Type II secretion system protein GspC N-terminal domain-containing protein n=1 Tax=Rhizobium wenxiniae TaxID=1737357 RepID=A0A7W9YD51_9HYPH|nr:type II secretion system protein N [Rhizobium wenxiniae]MBB6166379.1 hypothetical protein [Rhizobium wenxiniae]GGG23958.1 hypothetical protein GCM10010924_61900 [Rhizobium wenxiniae]